MKLRIRPNKASLEKLLAEKQLDALICMSPENFTYVAGVHVTTVENLRPRQAFVILTKHGSAELVVCSIEDSLVRSESWVRDITLYTEFLQEPVDALVATLKRLNLDRGLVGMDLDYLPVSSYMRLTEALPELKILNTTEDVAAIRSVKLPDEINVLERAVRQTHQAVLEGIGEGKVGETDKALANRIIKKMFDAGADGTLHLHLASGERTPHIHNHPGDYPTRLGEILRLDVGGLYGAYMSDFARTFSTGNPSKLQQDTYRKLCDVQEITIAAMKPGVLAEEIFFLCKSEFEKRGLPCTLPHVGHSFGIEVHERPMIRPGDKTPLAPGMVINIEPMTIDEEGSCYHTEDLVLITESGNRILTLGLAPKEIPILGEVTMG
ncbi:aminopeptidase P family protein [Agrobacterium sp. S2]|nr:aminopeptidase P family protein [Agrobacterium sp. S2]